MDQDVSIEELKIRLQELIDGSEALKMVSKEEREEKEALMMDGTAEEIAGYIKVFEDEKKNLEEIDTELQSHAEEINEAIAEGKHKEAKVKRMQLLKKEENLKIHEAATIKEASKHKNGLEEDGTRLAKEILDESQKESLGIKQESQQFSDSQISKARTEIKNESVKLAELIMEKVLDRRLAQ